MSATFQLDFHNSATFQDYLSISYDYDDFYGEIQSASLWVLVVFTLINFFMKILIKSIIYFSTS